MPASLIAALMQVAASAAVPPPPIVPVVIWANQAGSTEEVHLVLLAPTTEFPMNAPEIFHEKLRIAGRTIPVILRRNNGPVTVPISGYLKATYSLTLPPNTKGDVVLITDLSDGDGFLLKVQG